MTDQRANESIEIERKYEAPLAARLPGPAPFTAVGLAAGAPRTHELEATYFDTPGGALAARRLAVRRRRGGSDAGWHIKARGADGVLELAWPEADEMPDGLREELADRVGADALSALAPVAVLRTTRVAVRLRDETGVEAVELADDTVRASSGGVDRAWREWEAELLTGDPAVLERVDPVLRAAGAIPSLSSAKIARATGRLVDLAVARGAGADELAALAVLDLADRLAARDTGGALAERIAQLRVLAERLREGGLSARDA